MVDATGNRFWLVTVYNAHARAMASGIAFADNRKEAEEQITSCVDAGGNVWDGEDVEHGYLDEHQTSILEEEGYEVSCVETWRYPRTLEALGLE